MGKKKAHVRATAKAIIVEDGALLTIAHDDAEGSWYSLPGGGQDLGETMPEAVARECIEEANVEVEVGKLLFARDYIGDNHEFAEMHAGRHKLELFFACRLKPDQAPGLGSHPDSLQTGVAWLPIKELDSYRFYPSFLKAILQQSTLDDPYLGDVN